MDAASQLLSWDAAEQACAQTGGHLLTFDSPEHEATVAALLPVMDYWLGARRPAATVEFMWLEGVPSYFPVWDAGEPDIAQNLGACVLRTASGGTWRDSQWQSGS